ncbi:MAG: extracellular solute-binding protein [Treponema sp.]|nr:extracellular solute-binding protein [Treponema sp.]
MKNVSKFYRYATSVIPFLCVLLIAASCGKKNAGTGPVELVFWDLRTEGVGAAMIDTIISNFQAANPGIRITRSAFGNEDLRATIKPAINSGEGPDIFSYDAGAGYLGVLANTGMALDLSPYAQKYNWNSRFFDWALEKTRYEGGKLYGIANELEMLGVFYNSRMFRQNGLVPPETYDEFIAVCSALRNAGVIPMVLDDRDQWPGFHFESVWLNSFAGPQKVKDAVATRIKWTDPALASAMDRLAEFAASGLTNDQINSMGHDDANALFTTGNCAMRVTGTWVIGNFVDKMGDDVGFFYLPPGKPDIPSCPPGGLGEAVVINAKTKYPDETASFLDFLFSPESVKIWYEHSMIPSVVNVNYSSWNLAPLFREVVEEINAADTLGENIDVLMPPLVNDVTKNYVQRILAGRITGAQAMAEKQKALEEDIAAGNYTVE